MIPDEAVLAAAKVIYADNISNHAGDNAPQIIAACERVARQALEAAASHIQAQALRDVADAMTRETPGIGPWGVPQHEHQAQWLRERAAEIRSGK